MDNVLLMGIDIGTSACKVAVFRMDGTVVAASSKEYSVYYPEIGYAEQAPEEWWNGVVTAIRECIQCVDIREVACIGIDGQSWSCIPIDKDGHVLHRTPIWMDTRAASICQQVNETDLARRIFNVSHNPFQPSYTTPKILWFKKNKPNIYDKTAYFLQSNSYIAYCLTGMISQDKSQCYGLHVYDMENGTYNSELCYELQIDQKKLPQIFNCHEIIGHVTRDAAGITGLLEGTPVVAGGLDAACGTLGAGVYCNGQTQEQGGQAGGMSICIDRPVGDPRLILSNHVVPDVWLLQGGTVGGGASVKWISETIGQPERLAAEKENSHQLKIVDRLASQISVGAEGLIFLPYLAGERSPIWNPDASGILFGLTFNKTRAHIYRAVMEGAAYALEHNIQVAKEIGAEVETMNSMGGAANSELWMQIKADITGKRLCVPKSDTASTLGAAILAGIGINAYESFEEAVQKTITIQKWYSPNQANHEIYQKFFKIYLEIYQKTKETMKKNKDIVKYLEDE